MGASIGPADEGAAVIQSVRCTCLLLLLCIGSILVPGCVRPAVQEREFGISAVTAWKDEQTGRWLGATITVDNPLGDGFAARIELRPQIYPANTWTRHVSPLASRTVTLHRGENTVTLVCADDRELGQLPLAVSLSARDGDRIQYNDARFFSGDSVRTIRTASSVLLIAGQPSREYLYLVPALMGLERTDLRVCLQAREKGDQQTAWDRQPTIPLTEDTWASNSVVMLLDADPGQITPDQMAALEAAVNKGTGLIIAPGRWHPLSEWRAAHPGVAAALLPVDASAAPDAILQPVRVVPATGAAGLTRSKRPGAESDSILTLDWARIGAVEFPRGCALKGKLAPGAQVVMDGRGPDGKSAPLAVLAPHGKGRVLLLGLPDTWRWRRLGTGYHHRQFWLDALCRVTLGDNGPPPAIALALFRDPHDWADNPMIVGFTPVPPPSQQDSAALFEPKISAMTDKAIAYLLARQDKDSGWSDPQYPSNTGVTAFACLALMAEGTAPGIGPHGEALERGIRFLLANARLDGLIAGARSNPAGPMYEHAYATLALILAQGEMPGQPKMREVIRRALDLLEKCRRKDGGWRYAMDNAGSSDLSVTAAVTTTLVAAWRAGFTVNLDGMHRARRFVEQCALPDGTFRYRIWGQRGSCGVRALAVVSLYWTGRVDHPLIPSARDHVEYAYKRQTAAEIAAWPYFAYQNFAVSRMMSYCGDPYWIPWFQKSAAVLTATQKESGAFADESGNTVYPTALSAIVLQAPLGCLPIYGR